MEFQAISWKENRITMHPALHHSCLVSESTILYLYCSCQLTATLDCVPHLKQYWEG